MALQTIPGEGIWLPALPWVPSGGTLTAGSVTIDATGEKAAFVGRVFNKDHATKTINKVHFRFGTVVKAGGSALTVSLQDVSVAAVPAAPDETQDQYRAIANGDANFASNTWYSTGLITNDGTDTGSKRTVAYNELIAVVIEFDGSGRLGADSVGISGLSMAVIPHTPTLLLKTAGWVVATAQPNVIFEFSDGTFGTLSGAWPFSAVGSAAFKQDTATADEYALQFQVPFPCKLDGVYTLVFPAANTTDYDIVLYEGNSTVVNSMSVDGAFSALANNRWFISGFPESTLAANTTYRLSIKPTQTTSNVTLQYFDVAAADHFQATGMGSNFYLATQLNEGGSWTTTTTRRPMIGFRISAIDDGVGGGGGGLLTHPGMAGGMRG